MELESNQYDYGSFTNQGTGSHGEIQDFKIISYPLGRYEIKIKLSLTNEFIEIMEVGINKDFMNQKQKTSIKGYHDVDKFYLE